MRRAVPVLIVAFLFTLGVAAFIDVQARLHQAIGKSADELDFIATIMADRLDRAAATEKGDAVTRAFRGFERIDWPRAVAGGRMILLTDASSTIIATQPALNGYVGRKLNEAIGRDALTPAVTLRHGRVRRSRSATGHAFSWRCATSTRPSASSRSRSNAAWCWPNGAPTRHWR